MGPQKKLFKALSFWQPWAWFIVNGHADVDSRNWQPSPKMKEKLFGTRIAIVATKRKVTPDEFKTFLRMVKDLKIKDYPKSVDDFKYGAILGTVKITDIRTDSRSYFAHSGSFHWLLSDPKKIAPIRARGHQKWFTVALAQ